MSAIRCTGLTKRYRRDGVMALNGLDLEVAEGSVFGFLGPNGAGKTTAIRILTGLTASSSGSASVAGVPVSRGSRELARAIGCLDQDPRFYPWMTGRELLVLVARLHGHGAKSAGATADELISMAGLGKAARRRLGGYSGGMLQRLGIAAAVAGGPRVLFLDEPCSSLDPLGRRDVLEFIDRLRGRTTVFMSTHILADVERVCDTVGIIQGGRMLVAGGTDELARRYAPPVLEVEMETPAAAETLSAVLARRGAASTREGSRLRLGANDPAATQATLLAALTETALPFARVETRGASLEDVFVRLVGGAK